MEQRARELHTQYPQLSVEFFLRVLEKGEVK